MRLRYQPVKIGRWLYHDCVVTASGAPQRPVFVAPACGDVLPGSQTQFDWLPRGTAVDRWQVLAGSTLGGSDYFEGATLEADARTTLVTGLPRDGRQIYVRLRWREAGVWKNTDCLYPGYKSLNFFSEGTAERTTTQTCDTTPTSTGSPMPIANTVGCVDRTCVPPSPPLVPPVPGDLALPRVGFTTKGAPVDDPSVYTGTWALTGNYLSVCDGKRITETLSTGNFAVDQDLVTRAISGKLRTVVVPSLIGCKFDCTAPGQCTLDCPQAQGLRCAVTCTPATDFCDRESTVSGVVAPDGAISMSITHDQVIDYDCGDFGTIHMEDHQGDPENPGDPSNPGLELEFPGPPTRVVN